ncbi:MAG: type IV pilus modification PilV family protein [Candidatus Acidiferrum sp.]
MNQRDAKSAGQNRNRQRGFTLVEVLMAIVVLLVGIVAVAQLVPASISSNSTNRNDSTALVFAQEVMDQFLRQPLNMSISPPSFLDTIGTQTFSCNLGNPATPNTSVGSDTVVNYNQLIINFSGATSAGYNFTYQDPNDPVGVVYEVRWAVITATNNGMVTSKRFILGVRKAGGNGFYRPVTLDTILEK